MAFEGVTCPECGAKEGITKVEPDTYYCSHHKGLFKYVDPSRHEREFCSCGNRVNFQCRVCGTGLCRKCDIAQLVKQPEGSSRFDKEAVDSWRDNVGIAIRSKDFGYLSGVLKLWEDGKYIDLKGADRGSIGPVMYARNVMGHMVRAYPGINHACISCIVAAVPATVEDIKAGRGCEVPFCDAEPLKQCPCCHGAFCGEHVASGSHKLIAKEAEVVALRPRGIWHSSSVKMRPRSNDFCEMCTAENLSVVQQAVAAICQNELRLNRLEDLQCPVFEVPVTLPRKARDSVRRKVDEEIERTKKLIEAKMAGIPLLAPPCNRVKFANYGHTLMRDGRQQLVVK